MEKWIVIPNEKIGDIEFGMKKNEVRTVLGKEYREFKKNIFSKNITDDYGSFHVYYNDSGCEAVEFFEGELFYEGKNIMKFNDDTIRELFEDLEEEEDGCYISKKYSVGITMENNKIVSILLGEKGYYI